MKIKLTPLFLVFFSLFGLNSFAQSQTIKGVVSDSKGNALEGVTIKVVASKAITTSSKNGSFSIAVNANDVLEFSSVGFETKKQVAVGTSMNIILTASTSDLQDVILVGSRGTGRAKLESPVPVDVIKISEVAVNTARMDLTSSLNYAAPSFNYNKRFDGLRCPNVSSPQKSSKTLQKLLKFIRGFFEEFHRKWQTYRI